MLSGDQFPMLCIEPKLALPPEQRTLRCTPWAVAESVSNIVCAWGAGC